MSQTHLPVPMLNATPQLKVVGKAARDSLRRTWKESLEENPLRYALLIIVTTASMTAGIMGWVQVVKVDLAATKYETEKTGIKNDYEAQIRDLKNKIAELEKRRN